MNCRLDLRRWGWFLASLGLTLGCYLPARAQLGAQQPPGASAHRQLARGVLASAEPSAEVEETYKRGDVVELLAVAPDLEAAKNVVFRRDIWNLGFKFKPVRFMYVDLPATPDRLQRKRIWYMVYSVTNSGQVMHPVEGSDGTYVVQNIEGPIQFIPQFLLESHEFRKVYPDRVIPAALAAIQVREDPRRKFHSSADVVDLQPSETAWGIATWEDIDPRIDRFSIYVGGLTNAYKWTDPPGAYKAGDPVLTGRRISRKLLKLNFWRPGDEFYEHEKEIRLGIPGEVDYEWVYR